MASALFDESDFEPEFGLPEKELCQNPDCVAVRDIRWGRVRDWGR